MSGSENHGKRFRLAVIGVVLSAIALRAAGQDSKSREASDRYASASRFYVHGRYSEAIQELKISLRLNPVQLRATRLLGISYQVLGNLTEADDAFRRATRIDEKDFESWFFLGRVSYQRNFFDRALAALQRAVLLRPTDVRAHEYLALTMEAQGDIDGALSQYELGLGEASRQRKPSWTLHLTYGILLHKLNLPADSECQLRTSRDLNPNHWQAWFELAKLHYESGKPGVAAGEFLAALRTRTATVEDTVRIYRLLGRVYYSMGRDEEARAALAKANIAR